jgi:Glyoxalase-like domain
MPDSIKLCSVTLECPDAGKLAQFYAQITGGRVTFLDDSWATVKGPGGRIDFQTAPGYTPPAWPDPASSMQMHLDFDVDDPDATQARVLAAGATRYGFQPNDHCRVFADPAGHPFCLSTQDVPDLA